MSAFTAAGPDYGFGLYVHWPFCARICPYCDFNVYAAKDRDAEPLLRAMQHDLSAQADRLKRAGPRRPLDSIFLGGGTPSLLQPREIADLIETARGVLGVAPDAEISLEANPNDVVRLDLEGLRVAGVNRLSIGVQSLDPDALVFLGRDHSADEARRAVDLALGAFPSVSIDLIYARAGQDADSWARELEAAIALGAPHLSLYELTIEPRTAFGKRAARGEALSLSEDRQADLYELTQEKTATAGFDAYEISNHAISPAHRAVHNTIYWRSGDWLGIGPGAHGRITLGDTRIATEAARRPADYIDRVASAGHGLSASEALTPDDVAAEILIMGLREADGVALDRVARARNEAIPPSRIDALVSQGVLRVESGQASLTGWGRLLADAVGTRLLA